MNRVAIARVPMLLPRSIDVQLAALVGHWIVFSVLVLRHYHILIHLAGHFGQLFVQTGVHRAQVQRAKPVPPLWSIDEEDIAIFVLQVGGSRRVKS